MYTFPYDFLVCIKNYKVYRTGHAMKDPFDFIVTWSLLLFTPFFTKTRLKLHPTTIKIIIIVHISPYGRIVWFYFFSQPYSKTVR